MHHMFCGLCVLCFFLCQFAWHERQASPVEAAFSDCVTNSSSHFRGTRKVTTPSFEYFQAPVHLQLSFGEHAGQTIA